MPYVTVGTENETKIQLYFEDHGAGAPVILIHGYPLSGTSWEKQIPPLLAARHRVITYDRRGFGKSSHPAGGYDYDTFAADLGALITHLQLSDVSLVGFSMGGGECARYVGRYGTAGIRKVAILGGVPPYLRKAADNPEGVDGSVFDGIEQAVSADRYAFFTEFFKNFFNTDVLGSTAISDAAVQASWNVAAAASPIASLACVKTWQEDFRADVAKIDVPTLVMHGDADRIVPLESSGARTAKLARGAELVVIRNGPHAINWTHSRETNEALLPFLAS